MLTADFDYHLPPELIAQEPVEPRDAARMLVAGATEGAPLDRRVRDLPGFLRPGDCLVLNTTRVIPARLAARTAHGGTREVLLVHPLDDRADGSRWRCLIRGRVAVATTLTFDGASAVVAATEEDGSRLIDFAPDVDVLALAERVGRIPLPPYIRRADGERDRGRYQTVFAQRPGSVAAPTAALHFTPELLARVAARGVEIAHVDLAIGPGTFQPVATERIEDHPIHAERGSCPPETVAAIARCRARGGRVIAVGTTVVRTLETAAAQPGGLAPWSGWTRLFLHPPQRLAVVDGLLTNLHLPRSSLLMLVACLTGVPRLHALYAQAIAWTYRFYSYGDAMLLLPQQPTGAEA